MLYRSSSVIRQAIFSSIGRDLYLLYASKVLLSYFLSPDPALLFLIACDLMCSGFSYFSMISVALSIALFLSFFSANSIYLVTFGKSSVMKTSLTNSISLGYIWFEVIIYSLVKFFTYNWSRWAISCSFFIVFEEVFAKSLLVFKDSIWA